MFFEDKDNKVIKASFDRGFRELLASEGRPMSIHLSKLDFDCGVFDNISGLSPHVVGCEKPSNIEPLIELWELSRSLNESLDESMELAERELHTSQKMEILAKISKR